MKKEIVGQINWPFIKYDVIMPVQENNDIFEWLYLSLVLLQNEAAGKDKLSYENTEQDVAIKILKEYFPEFIGGDVCEKIKINTESDFLDSEGKLIEETLEFIETFDNLLSENVDVFQIFQDCLTGEVIPDFGDLSYVYDSYSDNALSIKVSSPKMPSSRKILRAQNLYNKYRKSNAPEETIVEEIKNEEVIIDPDAEIDVFEVDDTDFDVENTSTSINVSVSDKESHEEQTTKKRRGKKQIIVMDKSKTRYLIPVDIIVSDNGIEVDSPFSSTISIWLTARLNNAVKSEKFPELTSFYNEIKEMFFPTPKLDKKWEESPIKDRASQMTYLGPTFRILCGGKNNEAKKLLCEADEYLLAKHPAYFNTIRQYLESLIYPLRSWDYSRRSSYNYTMYCKELELACKGIGVDARRLMTIPNFDNWSRMKKRLDSSDEPALKPDLAEILMTFNEISKIKSFYPGFIDDVFSIYGETSKRSHYRPDKERITMFERVKTEDISKIEKITMVLEEIYEVKNHGK